MKTLTWIALAVLIGWTFAHDNTVIGCCLCAVAFAVALFSMVETEE